MLKYYFNFGVLFACIVGSSNTHSEGANVNIIGKVIAASCTINSVSNGGGQGVSLGELGRTHLQNANEGGNWTSFIMTLSDCPVGIHQASATFTGTPDSKDPTIFTNTEPMSTAAVGVGIQLAKDSDRSILLSSGSTMFVDVDETSNKAFFPLAARLYTPIGGVQAGYVSSSVMVSFTYK